MVRILFIGQETGGVGKSTTVRGLAEAVEEAAIFEIESVHRLLEFKEAKKPNAPGAVRYFQMRASRKSINETAGQSALAELDDVINALNEVKIPTIVDIGANQSASLFQALDPDTVQDLSDKGIELGVVLVVAEEAGSLAGAAELLHAAGAWAKAAFVIGNEVRSPIDRTELEQVVGTATTTVLRKFVFEPETSAMLRDVALRGIRNIDRQALIREKKPAAANRMLRDLTAFRLAVMEAVRPAAMWLVNFDE